MWLSSDKIKPSPETSLIVFSLSLAQKQDLGQGNVKLFEWNFAAGFE